MSHDDLLACDQCGRQRWEGERFCAQCGLEFGDLGANLAGGLAGGVVDVDRLVAEQEVEPRRSWREALKGIGALGVALAVLIGGLYLLSSGDTDSADGPDSESPTAVPDGWVSDAAAALIAKEEERSPEARPTIVPGSARLGRNLTGLDTGARWLITMNSAERLVAHDLETGEVYPALSRADANSRDRHDTIILDEGAVGYLADDAGRYQTTFSLWGSDSDAVDLEGWFMTSFVDPDVGRVVVTASEASPFELVAHAVEIGERRAFPMQGSLQSGLGFRGTGHSQSMDAPVVAVSLHGQTWGWDWNDGWAPIINGDMLTTTGELLVVRECPTPEQCVFSMVDFDGRPVAEAIAWPTASAVGLSPDGGVVASLGPLRDEDGSIDLDAMDEQAAVITLFNLQSDEVSTIDVSASYGDLSWSPNGRYLVVSGYSKSSLVDVVERRELDSWYAPGPAHSVVFTDDFVIPDDS